MKIVLIGPTPFLTHAPSKMHVSIIDMLINSKIEFISLVHSHDKDFFFPEIVHGKVPRFVYKHKTENNSHDVLLIPFENDSKTSIFFYEALRSIKPDIIISIGDYRELSNLSAAITFLEKKPKWISVLFNSSCPVNEADYAIFNLIDGIICTSEYSYNTVKPYFKSESILWKYVGPNKEFINAVNADNCARSFASDSLNIAAIGKNSQYDCLPTILSTCKKAVKSGKDWNLYVHTDTVVKSTYDFNLQKKRAEKDLDKPFIYFPEKCVSIKESQPASFLSSKLANTDICVSIPMVSSSSMSIWDIMACGCLPVVSNQGSHAEIIKKLSSAIGLDESSLIVKSSCFTSMGEFDLYIADSDDLLDKIYNLENIIKNKNLRKDIITFSLNYQREVFLFKLTELMNTVIGIKPTIRLESY